jgi:hypothetical protein
MNKTLSAPREPETAQSPVARQVILSVPQQQALEWLTSGGSVTEAAQVAGVCRQTVSKWLHDDPDFTAVYQAWRDQSLEIAQARLAAMTESALDNIAEAVHEKRDLRASLFVIRQLKVGSEK